MVVSPILMGGISNNLFQICTSIAYSLKHGCEYAIPVKIQNPHYPLQQVFYSKKINYIWEDISEKKGTVNYYYETQFHYKEIPKFNCDYLILTGYFQSRMYFDEYRQQILELLAIPYELKEGKVAIHIRRGDYLLLPNCHPVVTNEYILSGIEYFKDKGYRDFLVFTDDFNYCYFDMKWPDDDCTFGFSQHSTELEDLTLAASCEHVVGSNSAFSWFIYWLNRNVDKTGVFPKKDRWFGSALPHSVNDLYFPEWLLL